MLELYDSDLVLVAFVENQLLLSAYIRKPNHKGHIHPTATQKQCQPAHDCSLFNSTT